MCWSERCFVSYICNMEKLDDKIQSFRIAKSTKKLLIKMAQNDYIELQQICRRILSKAAKEYSDSLNQKSPEQSRDF